MFDCMNAGNVIRERGTREEEVDERVLSWMATEGMVEPEVFWDLRKMNGYDQCDALTPFWDEMGKYLELEVGAGAEERRTAATESYTHAAKVISIPQLVREVAKLLHAKPGFEEAAVPHESIVRLQFMPCAPTKLSAARFTARFRMSRRVQTRCLRKEHPDAHASLWLGTASPRGSRLIN